MQLFLLGILCGRFRRTRCGVNRCTSVSAGAVPTLTLAGWLPVQLCLLHGNHDAEGRVTL